MAVALAGYQHGTATQNTIIRVEGSEVNRLTGSLSTLKCERLMGVFDLSGEGLIPSGSFVLSFF